MANLEESNFWEPGIYQLETTDPLLGGEAGIDNFQAKQLANRTTFLKERLGGGVPKILAMVAAGAQALPATVKTNINFDTIVRDDANMLSAGTYGAFTMPAGFSYVSFRAAALVDHTPFTSNSMALFLGGLSFSAANMSAFSVDDNAVIQGASLSSPMYAITGGEVISVSIISLLATSTVANSCYVQIELHK